MQLTLHKTFLARIGGAGGGWALFDMGTSAVKYGIYFYIAFIEIADYNRILYTVLFFAATRSELL